MRVIARPTLNDFVTYRVPRAQRALLKGHLDAWYQAMTRATWRNSAELKAQYVSASILTAERVVFNLKGNDYRLIVSISYDHQLILIKWLGTHKEYDKIDAKEISYDKARYFGSAGAD